jgi:hypothetical protein
MNALTSHAAILVLTLLGSPWSGAQNVAPEPAEDPIQAAIREFNSRRSESSEPNEVTVVLDPPADGPVLVTGKPPQNTELIAETPNTEPQSTSTTEAPNPEPASETPAETPPEPEPTTPPPPKKGLAVRVEKLQAGTGHIDPAQVQLIAPFPAKPLAQPPAGWHLEASEHAPPFTREIELAPGKTITLTIRPHLLVPNTDGAATFTVAEPGFDPSLGYRQNATVGAVLSQSIRQLDEDSKALGSAIDNLQQLLVSLPKPEPESAPPAVPEPAKPATPRKR